MSVPPTGGRVVVEMPDDMFEQVDKIARLRYERRSTIVREALRLYLPQALLLAQRAPWIAAHPLSKAAEE